MAKGKINTEPGLGPMPTVKHDETPIPVESKYPGSTTRAYRTEQIVPQAPPVAKDDAPAEEGEKPSEE